MSQGVECYSCLPKTAWPPTSCISIDEEVVHGIPGERKLSEGDIVSIDVGVKKMDIMVTVQKHFP